MVGAANEAAMCASTPAATAATATTAAAVSAAAAAAATAGVVVVLVLVLMLLVVPQWSVEEGEVGKPVCWSPGALECYIDGSIRLTNQIPAAA
jgi:hypothetical protein